MFGQVAHQALHGLDLRHTDADKAGILQARSGEVDTLGRPIKKGNVDFAEVMFAKFSGQTFETNQRLYLFRTNRGRQSVLRGHAS
jgi:hypothetical protein